MGGVYHIINRGNRRQPLFRCETDYADFLSIMEDIWHGFPFTVHCFCLMTNHFHFQVEVVDEQTISEAFRRICSAYARSYNQRYRYTGHLFQDRFAAYTIDSEQYFYETSRYIHRNPVKARMERDVADYPYSSYRMFTGEVACPPFMRVDRVLDGFQGNVDRYHAFVMGTGYPELSEKVEADVKGA